MGCGREHGGRREGVLRTQGEHLPFPGACGPQAVPHGGGGEGGGAPPTPGAGGQTGGCREDERGGACGGEKREVGPGKGGRWGGGGGGGVLGRCLEAGPYPEVWRSPGRHVGNTEGEVYRRQYGAFSGQ